MYQNKIKSLQNSTGFFTRFKTEQVIPFLGVKMRYEKNGETNISDVIRLPQMQNYLLLGNISNEILMRYHSVIEQSRRIIEMINKQYDQ